MAQSNGESEDDLTDAIAKEEVTQEGEQADDVDFDELLSLDSNNSSDQIIKLGLLQGRKNNCNLCIHPGSHDATILFFNSGKDIKAIKAVKNYYRTKWKREFETQKLENHFKLHVEPYIDNEALIKQQEIDTLIRRSSSLKHDQFDVIREMAFAMIADLFHWKPKQVLTANDIVKMKTITSQFALLAKTYKDFWQAKMEVLGQGKSEKELQETMQNYFRSLLKEAIGAFDDMPEAQKRLTELFDMGGAGKRGADKDAES